MDRNNRDRRRWQFWELAAGRGWKLGNAINDVHTRDDLAEDTVARNVVVVRRLEIEIGIVRQVDKELGSRAVRRVGFTDHGHGAATIRKAVARFVVNGRSRGLAGQLGG